MKAGRWTGSIGVVVLALLAGTTAYYASKATVLEQQLRRTTARSSSSPSAETSSSSPASSASPTDSPTSSPATASSASSPSPTTGPQLTASQRLATPAETYVVQSGDTLYPIGLKYDLAWERIAEANGLVEPYKLAIGQTLIIPTVDVKEQLFAIRFSTDPTRAQALQKEAEQGKNTWRLDPVATAQAEATGYFGLATTDDFRLGSRDDQKGTAQIVANRLIDGQISSYEISVVQPTTKRSAGIWTLAQIQPK